MRLFLAFFALAFGLSFIHAARAEEDQQLDNREVVDALQDAIWKNRTRLGEGRLMINGESKGECTISSHQDDNHHGHVFIIRQGDKTIAYATIWAKKSRVTGRMQQLVRDNERRILVKIDNGSRNVRDETINLNRKNKRLSMVIYTEWASGSFRNATCVME